MSDFWEDLAITLLEHNLSGNSLNMQTLKAMFKDRPDILDELDIQVDGEEVEDLDKALYSGQPQVIEIREAKPTEVSLQACKHAIELLNVEITLEDT